MRRATAMWWAKALCSWDVHGRTCKVCDARALGLGGKLEARWRQRQRAAACKRLVAGARHSPAEEKSLRTGSSARPSVCPPMTGEWNWATSSAHLHLLHHTTTGTPHPQGTVSRGETSSHSCVPLNALQLTAQVDSYRPAFQCRSWLENQNCLLRHRSTAVPEPSIHRNGQLILSNMPPILHPRSRQTASLFSATLLASFFVVGLPHILPCPVDPRASNDASDNFSGEQGAQRRRRRRRCLPEDQMAMRQIAAGEEPSAVAASTVNPEDGAAGFDTPARRRECPVPKPRGLVGQFLGFEEQERIRRPVIVESVRKRRAEHFKEDGES